MRQQRIQRGKTAALRWMGMLRHAIAATDRRVL
jgi:hypothetical protein